MYNDTMRNREITNPLGLFNHLTTVRSDTGRDGQARQFADGSTGETVYRISTDLKQHVHCWSIAI